MPPRRRLDPAQRRAQLLDVAAEEFAAKPYDDVQMERIAARAGISRALLYRHFPGKRDLFAAVYRQAADRLLARTELDPAAPVVEQIAAGLEAHLDYFLANRNTILAANRVLAGDPVIQAVITDELAVLRQRLVDAFGLTSHARELASAAVAGWLLFVRVLCVEWLASESFSRTELREVCLRTLLGALDAVTDLAPPQP
ncbi:TetR/AcrR family transcriptional regulator [Goodfellowiella coeruleoviolacea]|uniref:Transcriptional regulator, TetR family n=1 Tax=Goodfellowiella coeruleoviolacea TaxID=334858 RepID=A0AAE3GPF2_9PSEU|nr:TetR/AcrR family transcriptional regulator [Goodfellowiella coeruleoviolacea]MCP2169753.1 transcriptional regulator, TetR family [Goodfellowiella coeruleoviolacea]